MTRHRRARIQSWSYAGLPGLELRAATTDAIPTWRHLIMPAGDPQRTWFPQMIALLRSDWHAEMSMPMLIDLRDKLDDMLHKIRKCKNIQTPIFTCLECGYTAQSPEPRVSVRAMILALGRFGMAPKEQVRALEKEWTKYRQQHQLDIEGKEPSSSQESRATTLAESVKGHFGQ
jgi:hypothetical protein